jgi:hypothetical protein
VEDEGGDLRKEFYGNARQDVGLYPERQFFCNPKINVLVDEYSGACAIEEEILLYTRPSPR